jgi:hypothetical protein
MIEFEEKTAKALFALRASIQAAVSDIIASHQESEQRMEAVVSQMFGECVWEILTKGEEQDNVIQRMLESYKAGHQDPTNKV